MASGFPGSIDNFTDPTSVSALNSPSHSGQHADLNDAVEKIETYMGLVKVIPTSVTSTGGTAATLSATGTVTIGAGNTSVTVNDAFSSLYSNYLISVQNCVPSTSSRARLQLGASAAHRYSLLYSPYTATFANISAGSQTSIDYIFRSGGIFAGTIPINNPNNATNTQIGPVAYADNGAAGILVGVIEDTTQFTAFTFSPSSGSLNGGTITVYGYRN